MASKIAAAYIRVSTDDQLEYSPDAQLAEIQKYAVSHGYHLPAELIYVDEGLSGKRTDKRNAFNHMIGVAKQKPKPFDAILLWKFSRFARNREDSIVYKSMLRRELGIEVVSISEPLTDDKMSILMEAMIEAMDEYYSINLAEEVKRGMTEKARRGGLQCPPAFGYCVENNILVPLPAEAAIVRRIFERFLSGEGLFSIAKWLNGMGATTHRGNRFENRTVEYILRNPVYIGKLRWNPSGRTQRDFANENIILSDAKHQSLVSLELWEAAQRHMEEVKCKRKSHSRPPTEHRDWLSGLVRCADCGSTLVFTKPHYWKCNGYAHGSCKTSQHIADAKLKELLLSAIEHDLKTELFSKLVVENLGSPGSDEATLLEEQAQQLSKKLDRLRVAYLAGAEELESYCATKSLLEERKHSLLERIHRFKLAENMPKDAPNTTEVCRKCVDILKDATSDNKTKHTIAQALIETCIFSKAANTISLTYQLLE